MAKNGATMFAIEDYTPAEAVNPYAEHVQALADAGEGKAIAITVETDRVARERLLFQKAANAIDKTARVIESVEGADGNTVIRFRLKPRESAKRGRKASATVVAEATE